MFHLTSEKGRILLGRVYYSANILQIWSHARVMSVVMSLSTWNGIHRAFLLSFASIWHLSPRILPGHRCFEALVWSHMEDFWRLHFASLSWWVKRRTLMAELLQSKLISWVDICRTVPKHLCVGLPEIRPWCRWARTFCNWKCVPVVAFIHFFSDVVFCEPFIFWSTSSITGITLAKFQTRWLERILRNPRSLLAESESPADGSWVR